MHVKVIGLSPPSQFSEKFGKKVNAEILDYLEKKNHLVENQFSF